MVTRAFEVALTIPDNEALTALGTLQRFGVETGDVRRADLWRFHVEAPLAEALRDAVRGIETIFNPNKHRLRERDASSPEPGEVWIAELAEPSGAHDGRAPRVAGRTLPGVTRIERMVAWRLFDRHGKPAAAAVVEQAIETLLCNPAFQRAIR